MKESKIIQEGLAALDLSESPSSADIQYHTSSLFSVYRVRTADREIAAKVMNRPDMAKAEHDGLKHLAEAGAAVPECFGVHAEGGFAVLFMEFIETGSSRSSSSLVQNLSHLYQKKYDAWGWPQGNFIGTKVQPNSFHKIFSEYFIQDRILAQSKEAVSRRLLSSDFVSSMAAVIEKRSEEWDLNGISPRMIHGDLWGGNVLRGKSKTYLIDPSVSYGHPEQDLAMLDLFGSPLGPSQRKEIAKASGLDDGIEERLLFWQIYPLLVHVNIFGSSYAGQLASAVKRYE